MILHIILTLAACWLLWVFYVCVMRLKMLRDAGTLTAGQKVLGYPTLLVGLLLDRRASRVKAPRDAIS